MTERLMTEADLTKFVALAQTLQEPEGHINHVKIEVSYQGAKYVRLNRVAHGENSSYCFLDWQGNVYKCAGYKAPAKGVRGNIFKSDGGRSAITRYGAVYLR